MVKDIADKAIDSEELKAANPADFKKIYDATMTLLFKVAFRVVNDQEVAEDLVHDSYIKANEKEMIFPTMNDATYWLIRVVKNASLNYVKRKGREQRAYQKALYEDHRIQTSGETDLLKEVLILREYADMNYKEIGKTLGITEGNVKVRVFRAREQLSKLIGEEDVYLS